MAPTLAIHLARMRRLLPATGVAAAVALNITGYPAVVNAEPVWDIEAYDSCANDATHSNEDVNIIVEALRICCEGSGGVWQEQGNKCVAPADLKGAPGGLTPSARPSEVRQGPTGAPLPSKPGVPVAPVQPPAMG